MCGALNGDRCGDDEASCGALLAEAHAQDVEIDYFARDDHAQVLHVTHDTKHALVTTISASAYARTILDDLDIRASDILQSNGIIWVEGPSDRIYVNKWIELLSDGALREGAHYQVLFYGGKLLAHLTASEDTNAIKILTTNRHVALLMDSDQSGPDDSINATKQRLRSEVTAAGGYAWFTSGREIENELPTNLLTSTTGLTTTPGRYDDVPEALKKDPNVRAKFTDKVTLAMTIAPLLRLEHVTGDLAARVQQLLDDIRRWNSSS